MVNSGKIPPLPAYLSKDLRDAVRSMLHLQVSATAAQHSRSLTPTSSLLGAHPPPIFSPWTRCGCTAKLSG